MIPRGAAVEKEQEAVASRPAYIHATALVVGEAGVLIRGPSGAGKSRLALDLLGEASRRGMFARLVGDDRVAVAARAGRLIARAHPAIAGQIESRGEGILDLGHEQAIVIRLVIDLGGEAAAASPRLPRAPATTSVCAVALPQLCLKSVSHQRVGAVLEHLLRIGNG